MFSLTLTVAVSAAASALGAAGDLGIQQRVSVTGSDGDVAFGALDPAVAYNPDRNEYLAVWQGETSTDNEAEIFGRLLDPGGAPVGGQFRISSMGPDGSTVLDAANPTVVYNPSTREYLVGWEGDDSAPLADNEFEIYVQRLTATGVEVGTDDQRISTMGPDGDINFNARSPAAAYNSTANEYLIAWQGDDDTAPLVEGDEEIFVQRLTASGAEVGTDDQRISTMGPDGDIGFDAARPAATHNSIANEYLIAWEGQDNIPPLVDNEDEIFVQRLTASGAEVGTDDQRISTMGPDGNPAFDARTATATYNPTANEYLVGWRGDDDAGGMVDNENEIFAQRLSATGAEVGTDDQRISTMGPTGNDAFDALTPAVTYNPTSNEYLLAWQGEDDTAPLVDNENEIFAQRLSATGAEVGTDDQRVSAMGPDGNVNFRAQSPAASSNPLANEHLIAWDGDDDTAPLVDNEFEVFARSLDAPDPPPPPPDPPPPADTAVDDPDVSLDKKIFVKGRELTVKVSTGCQEVCTSEGTGKVVDKTRGRGRPAEPAARKTYRLKPHTRTTEAGERTVLRLKLKGGKGKRKRLTKRIVRSIRKGREVRAKVTVELTDVAGNSVREKRAARLKVRKRKK